MTIGGYVMIYKIAELDGAGIRSSTLSHSIRFQLIFSLDLIRPAVSHFLNLSHS
jgi:hypothetical protein